MHNNRVGPAPATPSRHRRRCLHIINPGMRWETSMLHHTYRRKGHCRLVAVMGTTPNNNINTIPVAIKTGVPQHRPMGRVPGTIRNDPVAAL
jgi:hypothetical protein